LAIWAIIIGGIWAGIEFFWDKLVAPQFEPALVQISSSSSVVGRTDCCVLVEVETKLHNSGRRNAFVHASHIVIGAKKVAAVATSNAQTIGDLNEKLVERHLDLSEATSTVALDMLYGAAGPTGEEFLLLSVGHLVRSGSTIVPGESIFRRMALIVPSEFPLVSLRAVVFVTHAAKTSQSITWNWALKPKTLDLLVMPWRTDDMPRFRELRKRGIASDDMHARACREEAMSVAKQLRAEFFKSDRYSYIQPHSADFLAWKPMEDHVTKK
jgi:hypothetical protein